MNKLEALLEAAKAATPGPWDFKSGGRFELHMPAMEFTCQMCDEQYYPWTPDRKEDWEWIALANPATILELCALLEKAEAAMNSPSGRKYVETLAAIKQWKQGT